MAALSIESLRRRRPLVLLTAALAASALAVAGCGGDSDTGSEPGDVASFVPAGSPLYLEVTTDLEGPQWTQVDALGQAFPGYPDLRAMLDEALQGDDIDFETDVQPLLGERAAVAATAVPSSSDVQSSLTEATPEAVTDDSEFVAVVGVAEGREADVTALLTRGGAAKVGEHDGVDLLGSDDTVAAVSDGALVLSDTQDQVVAALEAHEAGGDQNLAGTDKFTDALAKLPEEVFGQAYIDIGAFVQQAGAESPELQQLGLGDLQTAALAASIAAEPEGVRVKGVLVGAPDFELGAFSPSLDERVPADAIAYAGFSNFAGTVATILDQVRGSLSDEERQQLDTVSAQLPALLGVSIDDLSALASGEHALVVTAGEPSGGGTPIPGVAVALQVDDGARAQRTLDALRTGVPQLVRQFSPDTEIPEWARVPLAGGVEGWRLPLSPEAGIVYGVDGDLAILGTSVPAVTAVQRPVSPLSESPVYQAGTTGMPDEVSSVFWLNLAQAVELARAFSDEPIDPEVLANLRPLKSIAAWATGGDEPTFELFARIAG